MIERIHSRKFTSGRPVYITETNTLENGVAPCNNYSAGWMQQAYANIRDYNANGVGTNYNGPPIYALCWFVDHDDSNGGDWNCYSLNSGPAPRMPQARSDFVSEASNPANTSVPSVVAFTGFERDQPQVTSDYYYHIAGIYGPVARVVSAQNDEYSTYQTPSGGHFMFRLTGIAQSSYSYLYAQAVPGGDQYYIVQPGDYLHYDFLLTSQATMAIDIEFTDGSALRDLIKADGQRYKDQNGIPIHPAFRADYSGYMGRWGSIDVLIGDGPAVGKRIGRIGFAYDNGQTLQTGIFGAYFDNVRIDKRSGHWGGH